MLASNLLRRSLCLGAVCLLAACEHAEGGVCQGSRDCDDGLVCDLTLDEKRGVCRDPQDIDAGRDGGAPDAPGELVPDASPDAATVGGMGGSGGAAGGAGGAPADAGAPLDSGTVSDDDGGSDADGG